MSNARNIASGAKFVDTAGDTMTGALNVNGGNFNLAPDDAAAHRYMFLNTGATQDGHIILQRALGNKHQLTSKQDGSFNIYGYAASGDVFNINSSGYVTMPKQPMFHATHSSGDTFSTTDEKHNFNTERIDLGGHFDTTNSRFVAPVNGYYFFTWGGTIVMSSSDAYITAYLRKNGAVAGGMRTRTNVSSSSTLYDGFAGAEVQYMAANDYMEVWHYSNTGNAYSYQGEYVFTGFLIG